MPIAEVDLRDTTTADVDYRIAATREERASAFRLVYESYLEGGLGEPNAHGMRVTPYHLLPTTEVFVASAQGTTMFTVSLVVDGRLGLPMETVYAEEAARRREQGLRLAEVSCLADRRSQFRGFFPVFLRLSRLMVQYARRRGVEELLVAVHPKHARFYRRYMDFRVFGEQAAYPTVRNNPAVALSLNFDRIDRERPQAYDTFFGVPIEAQKLEPRPIPPADRRYFAPMVDRGFTPAPLGPVETEHAGSGIPALSAV